MELTVYDDWKMQINVFKIIVWQFLFLMLLQPEPSSGETLDSGSHLPRGISIFRSDLALCADNASDFVSLIEKPDRYAFSLAGLLFGTAVIGHMSDNSIRTEALLNRNSRFDRFIEPWERYGNGVYPFTFAWSLYAGGAAIKNDWLRETGRECLMSLALATLFCTPVKIMTGRERPFANAGPYDFDPFAFDNVNRSFPSGHTTTAFALSSVLAGRIRNSVASVLLYGMACMTASQRICSDNHWLSDVITGAVIGTTAGTFIVHSGNGFEQSEMESSFSVVPVTCGSANGIGVAFEW